MESSKQCSVICKWLSRVFRHPQENMDAPLDVDLDLEILKATTIGANTVLQERHKKELLKYKKYSEGVCNLHVQ